MGPDPAIVQVCSRADFQRYRLGIAALLARYRHVLLSPATGSPENLLENTASTMPWLWLLAEGLTVYAIAALSDVEPQRHAYIHGVSHPSMRRNPRIPELIRHMGRLAFGPWQLLKIKAEFEADNLGAKGFCRRFGFVREGFYRRDIRIGGVLKDVVVASLTAERFEQWDSGYVSR